MESKSTEHARDRPDALTPSLERVPIQYCSSCGRSRGSRATNNHLSTASSEDDTRAHSASTAAPTKMLSSAG